MGDLAIVLVLLGVAVVLFAVGRPRMDVVALMMMAALPLTGILDVREALMGFSDPNIVLIAALFVIGDGLVRTGVAQRLGDWLVSRAGGSEARLVAVLMVSVATIGSVMSSTAVVAIFVPVVLRIARNGGIAPGRLMMPLSVAGLISGMMTLVATPPNLVVNSELVRRGHEGFHFFSFAPFGVPILLLAVGYMLLTRSWLSRPDRAATAARARPRLADWVERYGLAGREYRLRIGAGSPLAGRMLQQLDLRGRSGANILAIERAGRFGSRMLRPQATTALQAGDILLADLSAPAADIEDLRRRFDLERLPLTGAYFSDLSQEIGMLEVMLPEASGLIGRTVVELRFRSKYDLAVLGMRRGGEALTASVAGERLRLGDTLLLAGPWKAIRRLQTEAADLVMLDLPQELDDVAPAASRAPQALAVLALVVGLMVTGIVPNVLAALIGCLALGALGCISANGAYRAVHWQTLIVIVGMLPFSLALQKTGAMEMGARALVHVAGDAGLPAVLAGLFVVTAVFGLFISNTATAVLVAPAALTIADEMQASPYPFAMIVALAASSAFMTPVSSPVNTLVVGPGNYSFYDFVRIGVPFALVVMAVSVALVVWLLPA